MGSNMFVGDCRNLTFKHGGAHAHVALHEYIEDGGRMTFTDGTMNV